jgi:hypothetical protein
MPQYEALLEYRQAGHVPSCGNFRHIQQRYNNACLKYNTKTMFPIYRKLIIAQVTEKFAHYGRPFVDKPLIYFPSNVTNSMAPSPF